MKRLLTAFLLLASGPLAAATAHDTHAGHDMPATTEPASSLHDHDAMTAVAVPLFPAPTADELAAAFPNMGGMSMAEHMGGGHFGKLMLDRLEWQRHDGETAQAWKGGFWWGGDRHRLVFTSEGEREDGHIESETQLLWRRAHSPWWDTVLGLRHDEGEGPSRTWLAAGMQGLLPFFIDTEVTLFAADGGHTALRLEAEYEARLTNRLILQPDIALDIYGRDDAGAGVARGPAQLEAGLRLRYEVRREIAPYLGIEWQRALADTADLRRAAGRRVSGAAAVLGLRLWY
ncbi:MAG: copper resistance protein B [Moraxellaceae bacterium]